MIPKIIHYCWFGKGKYPPIVKKCIESWKKQCPDYEIKLWNEDNYDINKTDYLREAYQNKKWAFVSDYARLDILYEYGGFYLDTDVELIRSLDELTGLRAFVAADGSGINTGLGFGAEAKNSVIKGMRDLYIGKHFILEDGLDLTPCTVLNTKIFAEYGYKKESCTLETILGVVVLPPEFFSPIRGNQSELMITENTYGIHYGSRLWETGWTKFKAELRIKLGVKNVNLIKRIIRKK